MARRVNTVFVIALGGALSVVTLSSIGWVLYRRHMATDPVALTAAAQEAQARGDMKAAIDAWGRAAAATAARSGVGADELYATMAKLSMDYSKDAKTEQDAEIYYQRAVAAYDQASTINPRNEHVNEVLMEEKFKRAQFYNQAVNWAQLEEVAKRLINSRASAKKAPTSKPLVYLATAMVRQLQAVSARDLSISRLDDIEPKVKEALELEPTMGQAFALSTELQLFRARNAAILRGRVSMQGLGTDEEYNKETTKLQAQLADFLTRNGMSKEVVNTWSMITLEKFAFMESDDPKRQETLDAMVAMLEKAWAADKADTGMAEALGRLYSGSGHPEKTEQLFKEVIAQRAQDSEGYILLATFYRNANRTKDAVAAYKDVIAHTKMGGGLDGIRNAAYEREAIDSIAWLDMDLAEAAGLTTKPGQDLFVESKTYTDKLRTSHASQGMIDLLDGRAQLINRNVPDAVEKLHAAEAGLKVGGGDRLRQTKILLAKANKAQNQLGAALEYMTAALELNPNDVMLILERADLMTQVGRHPDAKKSMEALLKNPQLLSESGRSWASRILAAAESGSGNRQRAIDILQGVGATLQVARSYLDNGDNEGAITEASKVLENEAKNSTYENSTAFQIIVYANLRLDRKDAAKKMLDRALAKYPQNTQFQVISAQLAKPDAKIADIQRQVIEAIPDEYSRQMEFANYYRQQGQPDDEIKALQTAEKGLGDAVNPDDREKLGVIIDRIFNAALIAAEKAAAPGADYYWKTADTYMQRAERMNLDGVNGKIFRGRFQLTQSKGEKGTQLLEQAVAQRPDYAIGHLILGQAYYNLQNFNSALEEFRQVIRLSPNNILALQVAIELLVRKSDIASIKEAEGLVAGGLALAPRNTVFIDYSDILATTSADINRAIARRKSIAAQSPDDMKNIRRLGALYVRNKQPAEAVALIKPIVEKNPDSLDYASLLAALYLEDYKKVVADNQVNHQVTEPFIRTQQGASALKLFDPFTRSSDSKVKYNALIDLAEFCKRADLIDGAISSLNEAAAIQPEGQDQAQRHLGDIYFDVGDMVKAEQTYSSIIEKNKDGPSRDRLVRRLIEVQLRLDKYEPVAKPTDLKHNKLLDDLIAKNPDDAQALILRAYSSIRQKQLPEALKDLNKVLKANPDNVDALYFRAQANSSLGGDLESAIKDLQVARNRDRTSVNPRLLLAQLYQHSRGDGVSPRYGEAAIEYADLVEMRPDLTHIRLEYANYLMELINRQQSQPPDSDRDVAISIRRLDPASKLYGVLSEGQKLFPTDPTWPLMYTDLLSQTGNVKQAQGFYKQLYEALPSDRKICDAYLGSLLKTSNYEEIITISSPLIAQNPGVIELRLKRAAAYQGMKKEAEAAADIDAAFGLASEAATKARDFAPFVTALTHSSLVLSPDKLADRLAARHAALPDDLITSVALVHTLVATKRDAEAVKTADSIRIPTDDDVMKALILRETALARYQAKQYPAAYKDFTELRKISPDDVESLNNFAFMVADGMKNPKEALPHIEKAVALLSIRANVTQLSAISANVYDTLGWVKHLAGDEEGAVKALQNSLSIQPSTDAFLHLAVTYKKMKRIPEAKRNVQDGLKWANPTKDAAAITGLEDLKKELDG